MNLTCRIYFRGEKFVVAYNDAGTMKYLYYDQDACLWKTSEDEV